MSDIEKKIGLKGLDDFINGYKQIESEVQRLSEVNKQQAAQLREHSAEAKKARQEELAAIREQQKAVKEYEDGLQKFHRHMIGDEQAVKSEVQRTAIARQQAIDGEVAGYLRLQSHLQADEQAKKRATEEWKKSFRERMLITQQNESIEAGWATGAIGRLGALVAGYVGVRAAVDALKSAYHDMAEAQKRGDAALDANDKRSVQGLAGVGDARNLPAIEKWKLTSDAHPEAKDAAIQAVIAGGARLSEGRKFQLATDVAKLRPLVGQEGIGDVGQLSARYADIFPDLKGTTPVDLALATKHMLGKDAGAMNSPAMLMSMRKLTQSGFSTEEALSLGVAAINQDYSGKGAKSLFEALTAADDQKGPPTTRQEFELAKLKKLRGPERLAAIRNNPEMASALLGDNSGNIGAIAAEVDRTKGVFAGARGTYQAEQFAAVRSTNAGRNLMGDEASKAAAANRTLEIARFNDAWNDAEKIRAIRYNAKSEEGFSIGEWGLNKAQDLYRSGFKAFSGKLNPAMQENIPKMLALDTVRDSLRRDSEGTRDATIKSALEEGLITKDELTQLLMENLRQQGTLIREIRSGSQRAVAPSRSPHGE